MLRTATIALMMALAPLVAGCAAPGGQPTPPQGIPVDAATGFAVSRDALLSRMSDAAVVYLAEKHDNSHHQRLQLWSLRKLIARGHRPLLGFEMFSTTETSALMEFIATQPLQAKSDPATVRLQRATGMQGRDDVRWSRYGPLLRLAREHKLTVFGIDLPIPLRRRVSRVGIDGLTPMERRTLPALDDQHLDEDDASAYREQMLSRLKAAHCGYGSRAYLQRLLQNWQARNETMARAIATAATATSGRGDAPVLVVLGGQHVRSGQGVVPRLARHLPGARQLIVSFIEADEHHALTAEHNRRSIDAVGDSSDYAEVLWATAAFGQSMEDACKAFRHVKKKA
ncbi:MAG: putative iron-regulated protein [Gammaproteobacteria bacterium]|jgi:uncharacterized iron-regulated protein